MGIWGFITGAKEEVELFVEEIQYSSTGYHLGRELARQGATYDDFSEEMIDRMASDVGRDPEYDEQAEALYDGVQQGYDEGLKPWWKIW